MTELMLKPGWPGSFRRSVGEGKKARKLVFLPNQPVEVKPAELSELNADLGVAIFEIERDEKGRPRFIETEAITPDPTQAAKGDLEAAGVAHV